MEPDHRSATPGSDRRSRTRRRRGFTLLEMMAVIAIIGILAAFLLPNVMEAIGGATTTGCKANMTQLYQMLVGYQTHNNMSWPRDQGQKFLLRVWKDNLVERSERNARRFFCASHQYDDVKEPDSDMSVVDYLTAWDSIGPGYISYAGFTDNGDAKIRAKLKSAPSQVTIVSDVYPHGGLFLYMTADGEVHELHLQQLVDDGILTKEQMDDGDIPLGPSSPIEALHTVTNDQ